MRKTRSFQVTKLILAENNDMVCPDASKNCTHNYMYTYPGTDRVTKQVKLQEHYHRTVMQLQRMEYRMIK